MFSQNADPEVRQNWLLGVFAFFVCILPVVNILSAKTATVYLGSIALTFSVGAFGYALTFPCTDVITEMWGKRHARLMVWMGFGAQITAMLYVYAAIMLPPAAEFSPRQSAFDVTLSPVGRIIGASLLSYIVSERFDILVFWLVRHLTGFKLFLGRVAMTTTLSQAVDTMIFIPVAFYGTEVIPYQEWALLVRVILCQWAIKASLIVVILPACHLLRKTIGYSNRARVPDEVWEDHSRQQAS